MFRAVVVILIARCVVATREESQELHANMLVISAVSSSQCSIEAGTDCYGSDLTWKFAFSHDACCDLCSAHMSCQAFSFKLFICYLKSDCADPREDPHATSGTTGLAPPSPPSPPPIPPSPPASPSRELALTLVANMTRSEQELLVVGIGYRSFSQEPGFYVGNTAAIPRLGIPSINMQDAAQGFRTTSRSMVGQVTSWPCLLSGAAAWDAGLTEEWARALGKEHRAKGATALLGPSVNVHRVARGGRNAEYLSGESPYLGARMAAAYVRGVQSQKVLAVMKHFALNQQETNRMKVNSVCDERTMWEVYYAPFQAAVDAGVMVTMCSYNLVNGMHACGNRDLLEIDLKQRMGYTGFVQSDWGATHASTYANAGLDQDLPGGGFYDKYFQPGNLKQISDARISDMATRVLTSMISAKLLDDTPCVPPHCDELLYKAVATNQEHVQLARKIATSSAQLLKNEHNILPLRPGTTVALVGSACDAPNHVDFLLADIAKGNYYVLGGSGRVISDKVVSILSGVQQRAALTNINLTVSTSDDVHAALVAMEGTDAAIICGATTSAEAFDRKDLYLDQDKFISSVLTQATVPTVVIMNTPGVVLTPWHKQASAIMNMFLAGQETGNAWAALLFGDVNPSGKLPVTFPMSAEDMVAPCNGLEECKYSEKLEVGWRALTETDVNFPFGHGLSYTSFGYEWVQGPKCCGDAICMQLAVKNTGAVAGAEVPQLYLKFPQDAGEPPLVLRGFNKTAVLVPDEAAEVTFVLSSRDLSTWNVNRHRWERETGTFTVYIGSSSRDIRLRDTFTCPSK